MTAREIAEKFAGQTVSCKIIKSSAVDGIAAGALYKGKIVGWKRSTIKDANEYVAVEILPPGQTKFLISNLMRAGGYIWTVKNLDQNAYGKRIFVNEIILPAGSVSVGGKKINEWPHICKDCKSPAQIFSNSIDCSNPSCPNKFRTNSGLDLFLPKEMREVEAKKR